MNSLDMTDPSATGVVPARVAALTNILLAHNVAVMKALSGRVSNLRLYLSARNEPDRKNGVAWGDLDVTLQKAWRHTDYFQNSLGFRDTRHIQIPYDTIPKLWRYRPDVVISGQFGLRTLQATLYKLLRPKTVLIVWATLSQRTEQTRENRRIRLRRWILRWADACFTHGADGEKYLRSLGFQRSVFWTPYVIENDAPYFPYSPTLTGPKRLFCLCQLIERKGLVPFVTALIAWCREHPSQQVHFTVAGEGPLRQALEAMSLPDNLVLALVGHLDQDQIAEAYRQTDLCVFPTLADEWGMVVNEALVAGIPLLTSIHAQASTELVQDGVNGWLFDPEDRDSTRNALAVALEADTQTLHRISEAARISTKAHTPQIIAERMASAIAKLLKQVQPL